VGGKALKSVARLKRLEKAEPDPTEADRLLNAQKPPLALATLAIVPPAIVAPLFFVQRVIEIFELAERHGFNLD
jgi:hypothetical protein